MAYDNKIQYPPGESILHVNALSRLKFKENMSQAEDMVKAAIEELEKAILHPERKPKEIEFDKVATSVIKQVVSKTL